MAIVRAEHSSLLYLFAALLLVYPFFDDCLPKIVTRPLFLLSSLVLICYVIVAKSDFNLRSLGVGAMWLIVAVIALLGYLVTTDHLEFPTFALVLSIVLALLSTYTARWVTPFLRVMLLFLSINMAATLLFYFAPTVYSDLVKPALFSDLPDAIGYQSGLTRHYSNNGDLMAYGLILSASFFFFSKRKFRIWYLVLLFLFLFALVLTQKRSQLGLGVVAVWCIYLFTDSSHKILKTMICGAGALLVITFLAQFSPGINSALHRIIESSTTGDMNDITSGRVQLWDYAVAQWDVSPLFGNGWSSYFYVWPNGVLTSIYAHNDILQLLAETGIVGLFVVSIAAIGTILVGIRLLICAKKGSSMELQVRVGSTNFLQPLSFAIAFQFFSLVYGFTIGTIFQMPLVFIPFFLSVAIILSFRNELLPLLDRMRVSDAMRSNQRVHRLAISGVRAREKN